MKNKPIQEGYKIIAFCHAGYTYTFLYTSHINSFVGVEKIKGLTMTSLAIVHLAKTPTFSTHHNNIYMDNYFSYIPLFTYLRQLQIGVCSTLRVNSAGFPKRLKVPKAKKLPWNNLSGIVVNNQALAVIWMASACSAPSTKSTRTITLSSVSVAVLATPVLTPLIQWKSYNHNKNGVDLTDQLR
jgi:hypothetical protein